MERKKEMQEKREKRWTLLKTPDQMDAKVLEFRNGDMVEVKIEADYKLVFEDVNTTGRIWDYLTGAEKFIVDYTDWDGRVHHMKWKVAQVHKFVADSPAKSSGGARRSVGWDDEGMWMIVASKAGASATDDRKDVA